MQRSGAFIGTLMATLLAAQVQAAQVATPVQGSLGIAENTCVAPIAIFLNLNCQFSGGPMFPADLATTEPIGPLDAGGFYASAAAAPGYTLSTTPGTDFAGTPFTSFLVGLPTTPGDGKVGPPITGSIVIDDGGDGFGANDTIAATIVLGPGTRVTSGSGSEAGSATITETWTSITHTLSATTVSSATANGAGGFDYVLGSDGFPTNIFTAADAFASETGANSEDVPGNSPWIQANGGSGFNYDSMTDSGTDIVSFGLKTSGPRKNIGGATTAVIEMTGYVCSDVGLGPVESDGGGNPVFDTMTDCEASSVAWGVVDTVGTDAGKLNAGFDNLVLKLSTNASGTVLTANAYYTMEYPIINPGDNTWIGGTLNFNKVPPVANDDDTNAAEVNVPVSLDVLANDENLQSIPLTVNIESNPSFGTATAQDTGGGTPASIRVEYTYTATTVNATDSFTYSITDDTLDNSNTATVTVQVTNKIPTAADDSASVDELASTNIPVLGNDSLGDQPTASVSLVPGSGPILGTAVVEADLTITYTSTGGTGADSFRYTLTDYNGDVSNEATVAVTVCTAGAICAVDDVAFTNAQTTVDINPLANDAGLAVDLPLAVTVTTAPPNGAIGTITGCDAQGTCVVPYTPNAGFAGDDAFVYEVQNSAVPPIVESATVTITVNDIPVAVDDGNTGAPFAVVANSGAANLAVLANDSGLQDEPLAVTFPTTPTKGSLTQSGCDTMATCSVTYTNDGNVGIDSFDYTVTDQDGDSDTATVTVLINDQPVAVADTAAVTPNGSVNIPVLQNDSGLSDTPLAVTTTPPLSGAVMVENNNTVTYVNSGTPGIDTFNYTVTDADGDSDTATVTVTVADLNVPMAVDDTANTNRGKAITIDVLANDSGLADIDITVEVAAPASHGDVVINGSPASDIANIEVIYLPDEDFLGLDTFVYQVSDSNGDSDQATVTINVLNDEIVLTLPSGNNTSAVSPWSLVALAWLLWIRLPRRRVDSA